jgi:hypothetical protein
MVKRSYSDSIETIFENDRLIEKKANNYCEAYSFIDDLYKSKKINLLTYDLVKTALLNSEVDSWFN